MIGIRSIDALAIPPTKPIPIQCIVRCRIGSIYQMAVPAPVPLADCPHPTPTHYKRVLNFGGPEVKTGDRTTAVCSMVVVSRCFCLFTRIAGNDSKLFQR